MLAGKRDQLLRLVPSLLFREEVTGFLIDKEAQGFNVHTIQLYGAELSYFRRYLQEQSVHALLDITPNTARVWLLQLSHTRNPGSVHISYRILKTFFRWCWLEYKIGFSDPITKVRPPKLVEQSLEPVPLPDLRAMLTTCQRRTFTGERGRALLLSLLDTGCRASEFVALDVGDVNRQNDAVFLRSGKGGKARTTFVGGKSRRELTRYLRHRNANPNDALWVTVSGTRLTYAGLRQIVRRRAEKAGVPVPSLHSSRRAFALYALRNEADIYNLQRLMGHSDPTALRWYLKQTEADLREAHRDGGDRSPAGEG